MFVLQFAPESVSCIIASIASSVSSSCSSSSSSHLHSWCYGILGSTPNIKAYLSGTSKVDV
eukprot:815765-Amphidinium_carterae.1